MEGLATVPAEIYCRSALDTAKLDFEPFCEVDISAGPEETWHVRVVSVRDPRFLPRTILGEFMNHALDLSSRSVLASRGPQ